MVVKSPMRVVTLIRGEPLLVLMLMVATGLEPGTPNLRGLTVSTIPTALALGAPTLQELYPINETV